MIELSFPAPGSELTLVVMDRKVDLVSREVLDNMQNALSRSAILASINKLPIYGPR